MAKYVYSPPLQQRESPVRLVGKNVAFPLIGFILLCHSKFHATQEESTQKSPGRSSDDCQAEVSKPHRASYQKKISQYERRFFNMRESI